MSWQAAGAQCAGPSVQEPSVHDSDASVQLVADIERAKIEADKELEKARMENKFKEDELRFRRDSDENRRNDFDLTKYVKLVPQFNESDVDRYFQHFEKIAKNLHWPENVWSTLLQSALKGKAQETFAALSVDDSSDYESIWACSWGVSSKI